MSKSSACGTWGTWAAGRPREKNRRRLHKDGLAQERCLARRRRAGLSRWRAPGAAPDLVAQAARRSATESRAIRLHPHHEAQLRAREPRRKKSRCANGSPPDRVRLSTWRSRATAGSTWAGRSLCGRASRRAPSVRLRPAGYLGLLCRRLSLEQLHLPLQEVRVLPLLRELRLLLLQFDLPLGEGLLLPLELRRQTRAALAQRLHLERRELLVVRSELELRCTLELEERFSGAHERLPHPLRGALFPAHEGILPAFGLFDSRENAAT